MAGSELLVSSFAHDEAENDGLNWPHCDGAEEGQFSPGADVSWSSPDLTGNGR
jgi:hypothetical protein